MKKSALMLRIESQKHEIKELRRELKFTAKAIEKLAFEMGAPNEFTPKFVMLSVLIRSKLAKMRIVPK